MKVALYFSMGLCFAFAWGCKTGNTPMGDRTTSATSTTPSVSTGTPSTSESAGAKPSPGDLAPLGKAKVYRGQEGATVVVVRLAPAESNRYLVQFNDFSSEWDGKVLLHTRKPAARHGYDLVLQVNGRPWTSFLMRKGWSSYKTFEAHPKGADGSNKVFYSEKDSDSADAKDLVNAYGGQ